MTAPARNWTEFNHAALMREVAAVRRILEGKTGSRENSPEDGNPPDPGMTSALDLLCTTFGLSAFERSVLVLCAGMELDSEFLALCGAAQGSPPRPYPTFALAMATLPEAHWSAISPGSPLRHWRLVEVTVQTALPLVSSTLSIDERVLHFLAGVQYTDERLAGMVTPVALEDVVPSQERAAERIASHWAPRSADVLGPLPIIELCGTDSTSKRAVAGAACGIIGLALDVAKGEALPVSAGELEQFTRLWEREAALRAVALLIELDGVDRSDRRMGATIATFLERVRAPILLSTREPWNPVNRPSHSFDIGKPTASEQREMWAHLLGDAAASLNGSIDGMAAQFDLGLAAIRQSVNTAVRGSVEGDDLTAALWRAGRSQARPRMENLARRIGSSATWDDLVLPAGDKALLREISANVRNRATVYSDWGFSTRTQRGLGITALFSGASGTGKTMAAEVLANALSLDLYSIDLSSVVSKYIGETEKNLRRVFDAAEDGGAILFFDEADALFGKRSEVKDSHDRYANIEINYLLQRMEAYRGLAILATNLKGSLDSSFLRRIRFAVNFPFPSPAERAEIWRRVFPAATPRDGVDYSRLARFEIAGGNIRNAALNAAFLAADENQPVGMPHLWRAVRAEFTKLEKPWTESEEGWHI